jgi:hypothetical protein
MTLTELDLHLRDNSTEQYSAMVVFAALYKKLYNKFPNIGLSGQQAEYAEQLFKNLPENS